MNQINQRIVLLVSVALLFSSTGCRKKGCMDPVASNYSSTAKKSDGFCIYNSDEFLLTMLENIGEEIILPRYKKMDSILSELDANAIAFANDVSLDKLTLLKLTLISAEQQWQKCSVFELGPAETKSLRTHVNTFPTDTTAVEQKIASGSYDLTSFLAVGYKGLPALDYLLNFRTNDEVVVKFQNSTNRINFLKTLTVTLKNDVNTVYTQWQSTGGNYVGTFTTSKGSDISSSLSLLVNQFNYDYELIKNAKVGIPLGKATLGTPNPEQCEAYYGGVSSELAQLSLESLLNLYIGITENGLDKEGLQDYLVELNDAALSEEIKTQLELALSKMKNVPDPMSGTIATNPSIVDAAYEEIKKLIVLIKTDMPAEMEVSITYSDGDGD